MLILLLALEHYWNISNGSCLTTLLTALILLQTTYHLFTYLKNWLRSQLFNNNEMMEGVKT
jgi:small-conductance mechanosensitive channel